MKEKIWVLLVEDESAIGMLVDIHLKRGGGFEFRQVDCIESAEEALIEDGYDVVVTDLGLKNGSGLSSLGKLRKLTTLPLVVFTGAERIEDTDESLRGYAQAVFYKQEVVSNNKWAAFVEKVRELGMQTQMSRVMAENETLRARIVVLETGDGKKKKRLAAVRDWGVVVAEFVKAIFLPKKD